MKGLYTTTSIRAERGECAAFTVRDLAAVMAVTSILAMLLVCTVGAARPASSSFQCLNNLRQLAAAWRMYGDDHAGRFVFNHDGGNTGKIAGDEGWVTGWLDFSASADNTNTQFLINHALNPYGAFLGPYLGTARVFRCPADPSTVTIAGQMYARVRSYSMNNCVGTGGRMWTAGSSFRQMGNASQMSKPANDFVLLEERSDSINDGCFFADPDEPFQLVDFPAAPHNAAGTFNFADGHTELHRWRDRRTMPAFGGGFITLNVNLPGDVDITWLAAHASEPK